MEELKASSGDCPVCAGAISERDRVVCPRCETPHHLDCYSYNQGCAIFGCDPEKPTTPLPKKPQPLLPATDFRLPPVSLTLRLSLLGAVMMTAFLALFFLHMLESHNATHYVSQQLVRTHSPRIAAPDFALSDLDGSMQSFKDLRAGHVTVLTFWLAGCPDCLPSFPKGVGLSEAYRPKGVRFVDVAYMGQPGPTAAWIAKSGIRNLVLLDSFGEVVQKYGVGTYTCFVFDRDGKVRYRGPVDGTSAALDSVLAGQG